MKIAIVGSRKFQSPQLVYSYVSNLENGSIIVSGGATGVDTWAEVAAELNGFEVIVFKPEWDKYGKSAGFFRNELIVKECDRLVAFWDGVSKGTKHSIGLAEKAGKPVEVITYE